MDHPHGMVERPRARHPRHYSNDRSQAHSWDIMVDAYYLLAHRIWLLSDIRIHTLVHAPSPQTETCYRAILHLLSLERAPPPASSLAKQQLQCGIAILGPCIRHIARPFEIPLHTSNGTIGPQCSTARLKQSKTPLEHNAAEG